MISREDIVRLSRANEAVARNLLADYDKLVKKIGNPSDPVKLRDGLLELLPELVARHERVASLAATAWYLEQRDRDATGAASEPDADDLEIGISERDLHQMVRYNAGHAFTGNPDAMHAGVAAALGMYAWNASRHTVLGLSERDRLHVKTIRVSMSARTCAYCRLRASDVETEYHIGEGFHKTCKCQIVPVFSEEQDTIIGVRSPAENGKPFIAAKAFAVGSGSAALLEAARRLYPRVFTDGVDDPQWLAEHAPDWDASVTDI